MTIDPAHRLADALGIERLDNQVTQIQIANVSNLYGMMLDLKATWDEVVRTHSESESSAERLLSSRYYRLLSTRLTGSLEYMAVERLYQIAHTGEFDIIVVDTPPAQHALEFLKAPNRIHRLLSNSMLNTLAKPGLGLAGAATFGVRKTLGRLLGKSVLSDMTTFFGQIGHVSSGLRANASEVEQWLKTPRTKFVWITTPDPASTQAAVLGVHSLADLGFRVGALALNRMTTHPKKAFPTLSKPENTSSSEWKHVAHQLRTAWDQNENKAHQHEQHRQALEKLLNAPVITLPVAAHSENPVDIVLQMSQSLTDTSVQLID